MRLDTETKPGRLPQAAAYIAIAIMPIIPLTAMAEVRVCGHELHREVPVAATGLARPPAAKNTSKYIQFTLAEEGLEQGPGRGEKGGSGEARCTDNCLRKQSWSLLVVLGPDFPILGRGLVCLKPHI